MGTVSPLPFSVGPNQLRFKRRGRRLHLLMRIAVSHIVKGVNRWRERIGAIFCNQHPVDLFKRATVITLLVLLDQHGIKK